MTPEQWLINQLSPIVQANNPGASSDQVTAYVTSLAAFYTVYILPNLQVNLTTGAVAFVVPSGS